MLCQNAANINLNGYMAYVTHVRVLTCTLDVLTSTLISEKNYQNKNRTNTHPNKIPSVKSRENRM